MTWAYLSSLSAQPEVIDQAVSTRSVRYLHAGQLQVEDLYLSSTLPGADVFVNLLFKFSAQIPGRDDMEIAIGERPNYEISEIFASSLLYLPSGKLT